MLPFKIWFLTGVSRERKKARNFDRELISNRIFTGDVVEGAVWLVTGKSCADFTIFVSNSNRCLDTEVINDLNDAYTRMQGIGQTYAVVGNHDSSPVNSFPPASVDTTETSQWAYDAMSSDWSNWIGATAAAEADSNFGSYSVLTAEGLRIISVNTNFWYKVRQMSILV
jgi:sphingomyelin phosphodiesterase